MIWRFSDGTTVELGGIVEGPTLLAQRLRAQLARGARFYSGPHPTALIVVQPGDPAHVDAWLARELWFWRNVRGLPLTLVSPDGIPPLPLPPGRRASPETETETTPGEPPIVY